MSLGSQKAANRINDEPEGRFAYGRDDRKAAKDEEMKDTPNVHALKAADDGRRDGRRR